MKHLSFILLFCSFLFIVVGCNTKIVKERPESETTTNVDEVSYTISLQEFQKIKEDMSYQEVVNIIGSEGYVMQEIGEKGKAGYKVTMMWRGKKEKSLAQIVLYDGKVYSTYQSGLE